MKGRSKDKRANPIRTQRTSTITRSSKQGTVLALLRRAEWHDDYGLRGFLAGVIDAHRFVNSAHLPRQPARPSHVGLGMGFWIASAFVAASNGTIEASSAGVNKGMTVTIRLPLPMKENHKD
jgi:hypothetical protein